MISDKDNYKSNYCVIKKGDKFIPQHYIDGIWKDVPVNGSMWDNYSGKYSFLNAQQRLYIYMGKIENKGIIAASAHSIFPVGENKTTRYFDCIRLSKTKKEILSMYSKYPGKTEFLKYIFPTYFSEDGIQNIAQS